VNNLRQVLGKEGEKAAEEIIGELQTLMSKKPEKKNPLSKFISFILQK